MYKRGFLFGCSFTKFVWPTWADMLAHQSDYPVYNFGLSGIGNVGIVHRLVEADLKYKFNSDDLIIIVWSHWSREDRVFKNEWKTEGNIFLNKNFYNENFISKYWSWENDIIKNSTAILLANKSYNINDQYSIYDYGKIECHKEVRYQTNLFEFYVKNLPKLDSFNLSNNSQFNNFVLNPHPDIKCHIDFYNKIAERNNLIPLTHESIYHKLQEMISTFFKMNKVNSPEKQLNIIEKYFDSKKNLFALHINDLI
jgi:hypothetical protein